MSFFKRYARYFSRRGGAVLLGILLLGGLSWEKFGNSDLQQPSRKFVRNMSGIFFGRQPAPTEPSVVGSVKTTMFPQQKYQLMAINHIPRIDPSATMPHPFVGPCQQCHLYVGGPGPGTQQKTPVGAALEELSKIKKLGPPLHPDSNMPHPAAGRCIKCHDIVVKMPVTNTDGRAGWFL
jgi:hypothetical protein